MFSKSQIAVLRGIKRSFVKSICDVLRTSEYDHIISRVKTNDSITKKLQNKQKDPTIENAFTYLSDIIGVRIVTQYIEDVYAIANIIKNKYQVIEEIDYIKKPKSSGYRSFHIIINHPIRKNENFPTIEYIPIEIQIRTMGMDFWASLEHSIVYGPTKNPERQDLHDNDVMSLADKELSSYAEDIFSIDMRIQALKHIVKSNT